MEQNRFPGCTRIGNQGGQGEARVNVAVKSGWVMGSSKVSIGLSWFPLSRLCLMGADLVVLILCQHDFNPEEATLSLFLVDNYCSLMPR